MCGWQVKPCDPLGTHERFRDKGLIIKRYINLPVYFFFLILASFTSNTKCQELRL